MLLLRAQKVRTPIADFGTCFVDGIDAILTPTTLSAAFAMARKAVAIRSVHLNDISR
jgi:hypothetical protein